MQTAHKLLIASAFACTLGLQAQPAIVYQNTFDSPASLTGMSTFGVGTRSVTGGQLVISTSDFNTAGVGLDTSGFSGPYSSTLKSNPGLVSWSVNLANQDGAWNNTFAVILACNNPNPYSISSVGYAFEGGGFVGNRMMLYRFDFGLGGGGNIVIDIDSSVGLGTLPSQGSFRITYDPVTDNWAVFGTTGTSYVDPTTVSTSLGGGVDSTYTSGSMPYFALAGNRAGTDYFDNVSISVVPEPSTWMLTALTSLSLFTIRKRFTNAG